MRVMRSDRPFILSVLIGLLIAAVAISVPFLGWLLLPGWVVSWPIFPEGVHTRSGAGLSWLISICVGAALFWSVVVYVVLRLVARRRGEQGAAA
jgi:hypothetical protein